MAEPDKKKTSMGIDENVAGLLCYLFGLISGLIFYFGEKEDKLVRFNALQSIALSITVIAVAIVLRILNAIFGLIGAWFLVTLLSIVVWVGVLAVWIYLMVKAYQGEKIVLPVIGDICEKQIG